MTLLAKASGLLVAFVLGGCATASSSQAVTPTASQPTAPRLNDPTGIAFDGQGNLWVANYRGNAILMYRRPDLRSGATPKPSLAISGSGSTLAGPNRLAFDANGNLWVANYDDNTVAAFFPTQLRRGGALRAAVILGGANGWFNQPTGLAFDASGNLWISNQRGDDVVEIAPQDLKSGITEPVRRIAQPGGQGGTLEAVAFDGAGTLWLARYSDGRVIGLSPGRLSGQGAAPDKEFRQLAGPIGLTVDAEQRLWVAEYEAGLVGGLPINSSPGSSPVTVAGDAIRGPHTPAFDRDGNLWLSCSDNNTVVMFSATQISSRNFTKPALVIR